MSMCGLPDREVKNGSDGAEGSDDGEIELDVYTMEIKSTCGARVHLSKAQSDRATEKKGSYIVLVVEGPGTLRGRLKNELTEEDLDDELAEALLAGYHMIKNIYSKLASFPDPDEVELDVKGYRIKRKLWEGEIGLLDWINQNF